MQTTGASHDNNRIITVDLTTPVSKAAVNLAEEDSTGPTGVQGALCNPQVSQEPLEASDDAEKFNPNARFQAIGPPRLSLLASLPSPSVQMPSPAGQHGRRTLRGHRMHPQAPTLLQSILPAGSARPSSESDPLAYYASLPQASFKRRRLTLKQDPPAAKVTPPIPAVGHTSVVAPSHQPGTCKHQPIPEGPTHCQASLTGSAALGRRYGLQPVEDEDNSSEEDDAVVAARLQREEDERAAHAEVERMRRENHALLQSRLDALEAEEAEAARQRPQRTAAAPLAPTLALPWSRPPHAVRPRRAARAPAPPRPAIRRSPSPPRLAGFAHLAMLLGGEDNLAYNSAALQRDMAVRMGRPFYTPWHSAVGPGSRAGPPGRPQLNQPPTLLAPPDPSSTAGAPWQHFLPGMHLVSDPGQLRMRALLPYHSMMAPSSDLASSGLGALRGALDGARRAGIPAHMLLSDRDFTAEDYEMLLKLDATVENRKGASAEDIDKLPIEVVEDVPAGGASDTCAICLDAIAAGHTLRHLPCAHRFHDACIDTWLTHRAACPVCQQSVMRPSG